MRPCNPRAPSWRHASILGTVASVTLFACAGAPREARGAQSIDAVAEPPRPAPAARAAATAAWIDAYLATHALLDAPDDAALPPPSPQEETAWRLAMNALALAPDTANLPHHLATLHLAAAAAARANRREEAIGYLERAVAAGFDNGALLEWDPDLAILRDDPAFRKVIAAARAVLPPERDEPLAPLLTQLRGGRLAVTPDAALVVVGSRDATTIVDPVRNAVVAQFPHPLEVTTAIALSADGTLLGVESHRFFDISGPRLVRVFDIANGRLVREAQELLKRAPEFDPTPDAAVETDFRGAGDTRSLTMLDRVTGRRVARLLPIGDPTEVKVIVAPDRTRALVLDRELRRIHSIDLLSGAVRLPVDGGATPATVTSSVGPDPWGAAYLPQFDGSTGWITIDTAGNVELRNTSDDELLKSFVVSVPLTEDERSFAEVLPTETEIVLLHFYRRRVLAIDLETGHVRWSLSRTEDGVDVYDSVAIANGHVVTVRWTGAVQVRDLATGFVIHEFVPPVAPTRAVPFRAERAALVGGAGGILAKIDLASGRELQRYEIPGRHDLAGVEIASDDASALAIDVMSAWHIDFAAGTVSKAENPPRPARTARILSDGSIEVRSDPDSVVKILNVEGRPECCTLREDALFVGTRSSCVFVFDLASGARRGVLDLQDVLQDLEPFDTVGIGSITFAPDGGLVVIASSGLGVVAAYDTGSLERVWNYAYTGGNAAALQSRFSRDGTRVYVFGQGGWSPRVVDARTGKVLLDLAGRDLHELLPTADPDIVLATSIRGLEAIDVPTGRTRWTRIALTSGESVLRAAHGFVFGSSAALEQLRQPIGNSSSDLATLAPYLLDAKKVRAAAAGVAVTPPRLPMP